VKRRSVLESVPVEMSPWGSSWWRTRHSSSQLAWPLLVAGVLAAVTSRVVVALTGLPGLVNFLHVPLVFAAYLLSRSRVPDRPTRTAERLLALSAALTVASWAGSVHSSLLRTLLLWPILAEPILVILTIWHLSAAGFPAGAARRLGMAVVLGQLPIALAQAVWLGIGDPVQGTLVRQGAGHHVLGAMGLIVTLAALAALFSGRRPVLSFTGAAAAGGFVLSVLSDMKQGIAVFFLVGLFLLVRGLRERRRVRGIRPIARSAWLSAAAGLAVLALVVLTLNTFVILAREPWRFNAPLEAKGSAIASISEAMNRNPIGYLVGLGPGTTATRIAWLSAPMAAQGSFVQGLGLQPTPIATELTFEWANNPRWAQSSVSSPFSTWIGVFGDLGFLGLAALAALWWLPWRTARRSPEGLGPQAVILFTVVLGLLFNWMEEPILMITAALLIGAQSAPQTAPVPDQRSTWTLGNARGSGYRLADAASRSTAAHPQARDT
jgi:hypothetical protein